MLTIIGDHLDAWLHPSARSDALASARHRAFIALRLVGSLIAFATFPVYLVIRGAPGDVEVVAFAWLVTPILVAYFLSRTGRYEAAQMLSSLSLAMLVAFVAFNSGGIKSFAMIWLLLVPFEAVLCASRRAVVFAVALVIGVVLALLALHGLGLIGSWTAADSTGVMLAGFGVLAAALYAAAIVVSAQVLARASGAMLNVEEERYRMLAHHIGDVISRHRRDGAVQFVSPAVKSLLGVAPAQLLGHRLFERVHVADRPAFLTALSDAARGSDGASVEFRIRRDPVAGDPASSSQFIWLEMRCRPLVTADAGSRATNVEVVAVMRDITERKVQEQALEAAHQEAERANDAKARFLATVSHELRTPLNAIIGFSDMLVQDGVIALDPARRAEYARLINQSGQHLLSVVNSILDVSKLESGSFELVREPFAAHEALVSCCDLMALKARESGVDLITFAPDNLPQIDADPRAFRQIVINLVSNAIKFTERGGAVNVALGTENDRLILRVSDTGVGIASDDMAHIGDPFFQADNSYRRRHEGTGLGLSIVKSLVAMHGGEMTLRSRLGEGTTVTIALPLQAAVVDDSRVELADDRKLSVAAKSVPVRAANNVATLVPLEHADRKNCRVRLSA